MSREERPRRAPTLGGVIVGIWALPAAILTLYPFDVEVATRAFGPIGTSDLVANVLLFLPLGVGLWLSGLRAIQCALIGLAASGFIELAQLIVPGRVSTPRDLVMNTVGAYVGAVLTGVVFRLRGAQRTGPLVAISAFLAVAAVAATGALLAPRLPPMAMYAQWTPDFPHFDRYEGKVTDVRLGDEPLPYATIAQPARVRRLLMNAAHLTVKATAGPPTARPAPVFSIYDRDYGEVLLIGVDGEDAILRRRTLSADLRLAQPTLRVRGALAGVKAGDPLTLAAWFLGNGTACLQVNDTSHCDLGVTVGLSWAVLRYPQRLGPVIEPIARPIWMGLLLLPLGFWSRRSRATVLAWLATGLGIAVAVRLTPLLDPTLLEIGGGLAGAALGVWLSRKARAHAARAEQS